MYEIHYDNVLSVELPVPLHELLYRRCYLRHRALCLKHPLEHRHHVVSPLLIFHLLTTWFHVELTTCVVPFGSIDFEEWNNFRVFLKILFDLPITNPSIILTDLTYKEIHSHFVATFS